MWREDKLRSVTTLLPRAAVCAAAACCLPKLRKLAHPVRCGPPLITTASITSQHCGATCSAAARRAQRAQLPAAPARPHARTTTRPRRRAQRSAAAPRMPPRVQHLMAARRDV
jgi:hypothetical protein